MINERTIILNDLQRNYDDAIREGNQDVANKMLEEINKLKNQLTTSTSVASVASDAPIKLKKAKLSEADKLAKIKEKEEKEKERTKARQEKLKKQRLASEKRIKEKSIKMYGQIAFKYLGDANQYDLDYIFGAITNSLNNTDSTFSKKAKKEKI